jgi:hypothetical protein
MQSYIIFITLIAFTVPLIGLLQIWSCHPPAVTYGQAHAPAAVNEGVAVFAPPNIAHSSLRREETRKHTVVISANVNVIIPPRASAASKMYSEPTAAPTTDISVVAKEPPIVPKLELAQAQITNQPSAYAVEPVQPVVPGDFITRIKEHIRVVDDVVYINRFYSEHNLSFAKKAEYVYHGSDQAVSEGNQSSYALASLSEDGMSALAPFAQGVHPLAWSRSWFRENYFVQRSGFASNFHALALQIKKLRDSYHVPLPAIRYHTYTTYCKMIKSLGDPSVLPIPVMWTFRINTEGGHFSGDTAGKTCLRGHSGNECVITNAAQSLQRCGESVENFQKLLDSPKFLLLVTNQHQSIAHDKLLSLPMGVERSMAREIMTFYKKPENFPPERSILVAISNCLGRYSNQVSVFKGILSAMTQCLSGHFTFQSVLPYFRDI